MADKQVKKIKTKKHLAREQREAKQTRIILIATIVIGIAIVGLVGYGLIGQLIIRPRTVVARVGDTAIRVKEYETQVKFNRDAEIRQIYLNYDRYTTFQITGFLENAQVIASQLAQPDVFGRAVLDSMIDSILVKEEAEKRGIKVSEEEITERLQSAYFDYYPNGTSTPAATATILSTPTLSQTQYALVTKTPTPTQTEMPTETPDVTATLSEEEIQATQTEDNSLADETPTKEIPPTQTLVPTITLTPTVYTTQIFGENLDGFEESYKAYNFSLEDLREIVRVNLLGEKLLEDVTKDLEPLKDEVWVRHILVGTEDEALEVLTLLEEGGDFATLAAEYSTDEATSSKGGDLGWIDEEAESAEFTGVAFSLEFGEFSEPVETEEGFHIIQLLGERESQIPSREFALVKQDFFTGWLSDLRNSRDDIVIYETYAEYAPDTPAVPDQMLSLLYQALLQTQQNVAP